LQEFWTFTVRFFFFAWCPWWKMEFSFIIITIFISFAVSVWEQEMKSTWLVHFSMFKDHIPADVPMTCFLWTGPICMLTNLFTIFYFNVIDSVHLFTVQPTITAAHRRQSQEEELAISEE
jgi:hypothetical protein